MASSCKFERIISYPKPVQQPYPPILFGGATPQGRQRVVNYCDGWIPIDVLIDDLPASYRRSAAPCRGSRTRRRGHTLYRCSPLQRCLLTISSATRIWSVDTRRAGQPASPGRCRAVS